MFLKFFYFTLLILWIGFVQPFRFSLPQISSHQRLAPLCVTPHPEGRFKPVLGKHFEKFPFTLFRIMSTRNAKLNLREKSSQEAKGLYSFDYVAVDGMICPLTDDLFTRPNGMSLRPNTMTEFVSISERGKLFVAEIPQDTLLPSGTMLVHEFEDHFSLQPSRCMDPLEFESIVTEFLKQQNLLTKSEWLEAHPIGTQITV